MNEFYSIANKRIKKLVVDLSNDAQNICKSLDEETKGKVMVILLYYKIVLQGGLKFTSDVYSYVKEIQDCSIAENDINIVLDKFLDNDMRVEPIKDIELDDNPNIKMDVQDVKKFGKLGGNSKSIILDENPEINIDVAEIDGANDIVLDENPEFDLDIDQVVGINDIVLDDNPKLNINVEHVIKDGDIVLDDAPKLNLKVSKVTGPKDIILVKNPDIKVDVEGVSGINDVVLKNNPEISVNVKKVTDINAENNKKKESNLVGNIKFEVLEPSEQVYFDINEFNKDYKSKDDKKDDLEE